MNDNSTRKQFFSKLLGVVATASVLPKLAASTVSSAAAVPASTTSTTAGSKLEVRHDTRAVVRREVI